MRALSIRQPWAWAILHAGKDIENRSRRTTLRGRIAVHASLSVDSEAFDWLRSHGVRAPEVGGLPRGAIVGTVEIVDCVDASNSLWFFGPFGYVLCDPQPLNEPVPWKGALGFWSLPDGVLT